MSIKTTYLAVYNTVSGLLWFTIAIRTLIDVAGLVFPGSKLASHSVYSTHAYDGFPHKLLVYTQSLNAVLEIGNSSLGITRSKVSITSLQFFARCSITIGVCYLTPESKGNFNPLVFPALVLTWSAAEIIRYPYYTLKALNINPPDWLDWLRYSGFLVLYPLGLATEPVVIYDSLEYVKSMFHYYFFVVGFTLYIPGFYFLYTYMLKQRKRVLRKKTE
ncbi:PTPLA-domain-containing protein [Yamadazyma tenuis]|uniref:Very-long-chain (3R)-3-hydroxyacyl-CoA dehydratase n=1 Tax=Candida tenuis (strain ATCC 10573 / BCRC 21748 / CBS 615 / JCM 9827 / NBRC 10315 / NRRL Y-1498 / VKM Y-70) TaxID=590646 RepID=G3B1T3_CANTC|nr:PTPLA-domain-containing protein [Yamadazyma tenuis ATCC 10573]EGV64527.1 PTPLA-domain-containing protein [Yamadazyma tenuis ATCC 10573]WEJ97291.1 PTPLA-domain-containing protein [Yamadazyma tenuis]